MALDDRTLASSPTEVKVRDHVRVEVLTLEEVHDGGNLYELIWEGNSAPSAKMGYITGTNPKGEERKKFVKGLKPGDQFIVVYSGEQATSLYGPIDESKLLDLSMR